jgi:hypothetical protein
MYSLSKEYRPALFVMNIDNEKLHRELFGQIYIIHFLTRIQITLLYYKLTQTRLDIIDFH